MAIALDRRLLSDSDVEFLSPSVFFGERFPDFAADNGPMVAEALAELCGRPMSVRVGEEIWSIVPSGGTIVALPHAVDDALVVTFDEKEFSGWCQNQRSLNSFGVMRTLRSEGGDARDLSMWDSLLMTLLYGWPTVGQVDFVDRHGDPLDLHRIFRPTDDPADIAHFLREAGFLHLRGWIDPALMPLISADMDRVRPLYAEGDGKSWWAQASDGSRVCVRLQEFVEHSPATFEMMTSEGWDQVRRVIAADDTLVQPPVEGRCIEALFKPVGIVSGPSDLTFHRDCHLGRHAYSCSSTVLGVSLSPSTVDNGQLRVIVGSHRIAMPVEIAKTEPYMQVLGLATEPGDLTVHLSCTLHEATAPISTERRVMYAGFSLNDRTDLAKTGGSAELSEIREQVTNLLREQAESPR